MSLLRLAQVPPPSVAPDVTVADAVGVMAQNRVGAVTVVEHGALCGIFTERDLMLRVVHKSRDVRETLVREVMTSEVKTITDATTPEEASSMMLEQHLRHLPVVDHNGKLLGLVSIRALLEERLQDLSQEVSSLEQYLANDGPGG